MALFKGDVLIAGTNPSGGGGAGGGHIIEDSEGTELEQRPVLQFIGADVRDDDTNEVTKVITPSFREIQGDIPDTNLVCLDGIPIGGIIPYGAPINTLSDDWLPCLGQAVSRTFYHELFDKYGTTYGAGDGSTTFNLPNYGGRVPVGLDENDTDFDTLGETIGEKTHTLTSTEMPSHKHNRIRIANGNQYLGPASGSNLNVAGINLNTGAYPYTNETYNNAETSSAGGGQSHNNIQPSIVANYIVKAKTSSHTITTSNVMTVHNESDVNTYSTNYINNNFGGNILWRNQSVTSTMPANTQISLNSDNYDYIIWLYYYSNTVDNSKILKSSICLKGSSVMLNIIGYSTNNRMKRILDYSNDTTYIARVGKDESNSDAAGYCIPYVAIGCHF